MNNKKKADNLSVNLEAVEKWLENYFLDPHTTHCDLTQFRIDLYETDSHWIVEAVLTDYTSSEITVKAESNKLIISAEHHIFAAPSPKRVRTIDFPFRIIQHDVNASFQHGILEIFISKTDAGLGKNRYITLP